LIVAVVVVSIPIWVFAMVQFFKKPAGWQWRFLLSIVLFIAIGRLGMWAIDVVDPVVH
jgi:hypothetical protein